MVLEPTPLPRDDGARLDEEEGDEDDLHGTESESMARDPPRTLRDPGCFDVLGTDRVMAGRSIGELKEILGHTRSWSPSATLT